MSNHDAGRIVSSVIKKTLNFFNEEKISQEVAKELIRTAINGALGYDGNDYECVEEIEGNYCGRCLKKEDEIYDFEPVFWDHYPEELPLKGKEQDIYWNDSSYLFNGFCKECMDEWLEENIPQVPKEEYYKLMK